jgi:hypothetical protein
LSGKQAFKLVIGTGLVTAVAAAAALAANPIKGATYNGSWGTAPAGGTVQFKVSSSGKKVSGFRLGSVPLKCQGVIPLANSGSATVSKTGKFVATLSLFFPPTQPSRHVGTVVVSGTFLKGRKESGKLATKYSGHGFNKSCDKTVTYSTKG